MFNTGVSACGPEAGILRMSQPVLEFCWATSNVRPSGDQSCPRVIIGSSVTGTPFPVADNMAGAYGAGQIGGTIIGIPKGSTDAADAWQVVKYLGLGTQAEESLAQMLKNVPTTLPSLKDPALSSDPNFATFLKMAAPRLSANPVTTAFAKNCIGRS